MALRRGDLVTVAISGDYGKARPALIIQDDAFAALKSVTILRITSEARDAPDLRISIAPGPENGLRLVSQIMSTRRRPFLERASPAHRPCRRGDPGQGGCGARAISGLAGPS